MRVNAWPVDAYHAEPRANLIMTRLPSLNAIKCFSVAARLRSFTAAAQELNVTQGAVSRMVQTLEQELGVQLFTRNGRFIALTPLGQRYYEGVSDALERIRDASTQVRKAVQNEVLPVIVSAGFATRWLVPRLPGFQREHPGIRVAILTNEQDGAVTDGRTHVRIRYGAGPWRGYASRRLPLPTELGVVCAPSLCPEGGLRGPEELADKLLICMDESRDLLSEYFAHFGVTPPDLTQVGRFHQLLMLAEAAVAGLGFAVVPLFLFESELASGRLVKAMAQTVRSERGYFVLHKTGEEADHRIQAFRSWLLGLRS